MATDSTLNVEAVAGRDSVTIAIIDDDAGKRTKWKITYNADTKVFLALVL